MEATVGDSSLNATQWFVVETFAAARTEKDKEELTSFYLDYIQQKLNKETDKWWEENNMSNEKLKEILNTHYRTPYK